MSANNQTDKPHSPFRSRPVQFAADLPTPVHSSVPRWTNDDRKRRASEPVGLLDGSNMATAKNHGNKKMARYSVAAASSDDSTGRIITKSPYEKDFCAEWGEPLFDKVAQIFASLAELDK